LSAERSGPGSFGPSQPWGELLALAEDEAGERALLERLLSLWCANHGASAAALYLDRRGAVEQVAAVGRGLPVLIAEESLRQAEPGRLRLPGGWLLFSPPGFAGAIGNDPLPLLLASALKSARLRQELKDQQFQVNYRVVELEALYDVGLAVSATLDLDRVSEEILLRAVSLLDARRGALYILEDGRHRLDRTFGGEAGRWLGAEEPALAAFLSGAEAPAELLPGARFLLGVPILFENSPRGMLVVGDKESRRGVGPFLPGDRRTLGLFANQAAIALENARLHLRALEQERLEREMQVAAEIQRRILPKQAPPLPGFQLTGWNRPAREVGGDYFDLFTTRDGVALVVGDVTGKGIPAALMVSTLHSALHLLLDQIGFGPALLERLSRHILESSTANKFITMIIAEVNPRTAGLRYVNAGHNAGFLLRGDGRGAQVEELPSTGVPLGLLPGSRYQMREVMLEPGDLVCLYSDGITEAESMADEEFGNDRLIDLLRRHREAPLAGILDAVRTEVGEHAQGRPQGDDQTVVLLRRDPG
jgi:sigma-B regulation protein RsbU (phosphoserine phosphatase)